ncbi:unnamed protein product [Withania somnifera]
MMEGCRGTQVYALNPPGTTRTTRFGDGGGEKFLQNLLSNSVWSRSNHNFQDIQSKDEVNSAALAAALASYGLPKTDQLEPQIGFCLKPVNFVETLADVYCRMEGCAQFDKSRIYLEQCAIFRGLPDPKLFRRSLMSARLHAVDVHTKVVLSAWLRFERREDELIGVSAMDCCDRRMECPGSALVVGYTPESATDPCICHWGEDTEIYMDEECQLHLVVEMRRRILTCYFALEMMKSVFQPDIVLELLSLANKFCCDEMKSVCAYLASLVFDMDSAMLLFEYGLEENVYLLVAACLQVFLRELPNSMHNPNGARTCFFFSLLLSENVMLLERMGECASEGWQKQLAFHQLGCVMLERKEYKDAQKWFEEAVEAGHVYSLVAIARSKYKRGHMYKAYKLMNSLISDYTPSGWMYQERSMYCQGKGKTMDLSTASELDPTLSYPYKFRAVSKAEDNRVGPAISEINKILGFKISPDCLELRAWFLISLEDYEGALRDFRALLQSEHLVELLSHNVQPCKDIGSLAVVHHMLAIDPGKSLLRFRQSLLLLRVNSHKAAMRSLREARNQATSEHEKLVYEGWILSDTGYREEAIAKAEESISILRSFEAFFLEAYVLSETSPDSESSLYIIQLLEEALRCPSDGLRKGQSFLSSRTYSCSIFEQRFMTQIGDLTSAIRDCEAALCLDSNHADTLDLYQKVQQRAKEQLPT